MRLVSKKFAVLCVKSLNRSESKSKKSNLWVNGNRCVESRCAPGAARPAPWSTMPAPQGGLSPMATTYSFQSHVRIIQQLQGEDHVHAVAFADVGEMPQGTVLLLVTA